MLVLWTFVFSCCFALFVQSANVPPGNGTIAEILKAPGAASEVTEVIRRKRLGELHGNVFTPGRSVTLSVPPLAQTCRMTCGPTCVPSILHFFGDRHPTMSLHGRISGNAYIDSLILAMGTEPHHPVYGGTYPGNLIAELNRRIVSNNFNSGRTYVKREMFPVRADDFTREVYNSLINNSPVIFAFDGGYTPYEQPRRHFVIIYGARITQQGAQFHCMDPDGGQHQVFTTGGLSHLIRSDGYIIYYHPQIEYER